MRILLSIGLVGAIAFVALGTTPKAHAGLLTAYDASTLVQSTASDADAMLLGKIYGFQYNQTLTYSSTADPTSWSGTLAGTYLGSSLNLSYAGDLTNYASTGAVTWTSTGAFGGQAWSGTGSAAIADTSSTTFQVSILYSLTAGSNTASIDYVIPGTVGATGTVMFGSPGNEEAGTGTVTINGREQHNLVEWSYIHTKTGRAIRSDIVILGHVFWFNNLDDQPIGGRSGGLFGSIESVPEPPAHALLAIGLLAVATVRTRSITRLVCRGRRFIRP
jgi:hypothetical protein